jgi:hypothetical protein
MIGVLKLRGDAELTKRGELLGAWELAASASVGLTRTTEVLHRLSPNLGLIRTEIAAAT